MNLLNAQIVYTMTTQEYNTELESSEGCSPHPCWIIRIGVTTVDLRVGDVHEVLLGRRDGSIPCFQAASCVCVRDSL